MARTTTDDGRPIISRSPRTASKIFGLDQDMYMGSPAGGAFSGPPRPKFLFVVRFIRGAGQGTAKWKDGLSFAVRMVDRPTITPQLQEMVQYNKKRLIHTGIKYNTVNIEFYDSVDAVVSQMWHEYASYYFGDFRGRTDMDWGYDVTTSQMFDTAKRGFGVSMPDNTGPDTTQSSFFFDKVECYQFYGAQYIQFDLIKPKISSFNPDAMEYDNMGAHGIRLGLDYEGVIYHNSGMPADMMQNVELVELYGNQLGGDDIYDPPGSYKPSIFQTAKSAADSFNNIPSAIGRIIGNEKLAGTTIIPSKITKGLGVLSTYGVFDFEGGISKILAPITGSISNILNSDVSSVTNGENSKPEFPNGINASKFDVAISQTQKALGKNSSPEMVKAVTNAAITGNSSLATLNEFRPAGSKIGIRQPAKTDDPLL